MSSGTLFIRDSRTDTNYEIPIQRNSIRATDLQRIKSNPMGSDRADQVSCGLRVHDPGLQNTAVTNSAISFSCVLAHPMGAFHLTLAQRP